MADRNLELAEEGRTTPAEMLPACADGNAWVVAPPGTGGHRTFGEHDALERALEFAFRGAGSVQALSRGVALR